MPKAAIAIGLAGLLLAGVSATGKAASITPPSKSAIMRRVGRPSCDEASLGNSNIVDSRFS
jgi:hypothetical protein